MSIIERLRELDTQPLREGAHSSRVDGLCVMEAAAYVANEKHSDHPQCVSPIIADFMRSWNDSLRSDEERDQLLRPLILSVLNTRSTPEAEERRA